MIKSMVLNEPYSTYLRFSEVQSWHYTILSTFYSIRNLGIVRPGDESNNISTSRNFSNHNIVDGNINRGK